MLQFVKYFFNNDFKPHVIANELAQDIEDDIYVRYLALAYTEQEAEEFFFDHSGCCLAVRSLETFNIDGLSVVFPSDYLLMGLSEVLQASPRFINGKSYFKLYSSMGCLILTPEQHKNLCSQIRADLDGIIERGTIDQQKLISGLNSLRNHDNFVVSKSVPEQSFEN